MTLDKNNVLDILYYMVTKEEKGNTVYRYDGWKATFWCNVKYEYKSTALFQPIVKDKKYLDFHFNPEENYDKVIEYLETQISVMKGSVKIISLKNK